MKNGSAEKEQLERVVLGARMARVGLRAAECASQCHESVELALRNPLIAGFLFADCLGEFRRAAHRGEALLAEGEQVSDSLTDPFEAIFPGSFCYSRSLVFFLSCRC